MVAYVDLPTFKAAVGIADTAEDLAIQLALDAAREWIDNYCGRTFTPLGDTSAHIYDPFTYDRIWIDDAVSISQVANDTNFDGTFAHVLDPASYELYPLDVGRPGTTTQGGYTEIRLRPTFAWLFAPYWYYWTPDQIFLPGRQVRVTATWGYIGNPQPPAAVAHANILLANRYFRRQTAPFGVIESIQFGTVDRIPGVDNDVLNLLDAYRAPNTVWLAV